MRTAPVIGLRIAARLLGSMCENNPRLMESKNWHYASQGVAGLIKEIESLNGFVDVVVTVDFRAEVEAAQVWEDDPRQLRFGGGLCSKR